MFKIFWLFLSMSALVSVLWAQDKQFMDDWNRVANSPGSTLTLKETGRTKLAGRTVVSYRLFASGLPKKQHFTLWTWNLGSQPQSVADAFINSDGLIVNQLADATHKEDPIDIRGFAGLGERKRFAITSDDWSQQAFAEVVPFPLEQVSNGCELHIETASPAYESVVVHGSGFQANELLTVDVHSGPEGGKRQATATGDGKYTAVIFPAVKGQKSGRASVAITSQKCSVAVQFPWGEGSYQIQ